MADVFLSYSRSDEKFANLLHDALRDRGCEAWVDVTKLRPAENWRETIRTEIDQANAVLFVLTPAWLGSLECANELQRATEQNKRMIPLLHREVKVAAVPDALATLNWLPFRESDNFEAGVAQLEQALATDLDAVKLHSRLLVRAAEWAAHERNGSYTLRGADLSEAESWLGRTPGRDATPTDLQVQYILASRKAVARRQRITIASIAVASLVAVSLGLIAHFQSEQRARQERIAAARESINQANTLRMLPDAPARLHDSVQSAVRALREFTALGMHAADADESVRRGIALLPGAPVTFATRAGSIDYAVFDPSGRLLAMAFASDEVVVWDVIRQRERVSWQRALPAGADTLAIEVAAEPGYLATLVYDSTPTVNSSTVTVWHVERGSVVAEFHQEGRAEALRLSPTGQQVYIRRGLEPWSGWDVTSGEQLRPASADRIIYGFAPSPDGTSIALAYRVRGVSGEYFVDILDAETFVRKSGWTEADRMRLLKWTPDSAHVLVVTANIAVLRNTATGGAVGSFPRQGRPLGETPDGQLGREASLTLSPDGRLLAVNNAYDAVSVYDMATGAEYRRLIDPSEVKAMAFTPEGSSVVTFAGDGRIRQWSVVANDALAEFRHEDAIESVSFDLPSNLLVTSSAASRQGWRLPAPDAILTGTYLTERVDVSPTPPASSLARVEVSEPHGKTVTLLGPDGGVMARVDFANRVTAGAVSHDGRKLAVLMAERTRGRSPVTLEMWDSQKGVRLHVTPSPEYASWLTFSEDDRSLITRGDEGFVFRSVENLEHLGTIYHTAPRLLALQMDGTRIATTGGDGNVRVWSEIGPGATEMTRIATGQPLSHLALSADGRWLAGVTAQGVARLWGVQAEDLVALACARLPHDCDE